MAIGSVVVTVDGESKCGKTTFIDNVATEAQYQADIIPNVLEDPAWSHLDDETRNGLMSQHKEWSFKNITMISGGNVYRAAALFAMLQEIEDKAKTEFVPEDAPAVEAMMAVEGITDLLQNDPNISARVSEISQLPGIQNVCSRLLSQSILQAYFAEPGENLVVVDARDPVGHLLRNAAVGDGVGQVSPDAIIPIYIDTPVEVAASRMKGDYDSNLTEVKRRRQADATRLELPVIRPSHTTDVASVWIDQFLDPRHTPAMPLLLRNTSEIDLGNIQYIAGQVAALASDIAIRQTHPLTNAEREIVQAYRASSHA